MATVNATLSNFYGIAGLASRGIGTGEVRSHPTIPTFFQNMGKMQGVNYASRFSEAVMGKGSLTEAVNSYSEEKSSFQSDFKDAMDKAKKTGAGLNNLNYGANKKESPLETLHQNNITGNLNKKDDRANMLVNNRTDDVKDDKENELTATAKEDKEKRDDVVNEARTTPPFQAEIESATPVSPAPTEGIAAPSAMQAPEDKVSAVSNLMENYNDTIGFLQSRMGTSETFDRFASSFGGDDELTGNMDKIGVQVEPVTGMISVDTKTLTDAIKESPDSVENILGKNGFGGRIERNSEAGNFGSDRMYPSFTESLGGQNDNRKGMYDNMSHITSTPKGNLGNLMDTNY